MATSYVKPNIDRVLYLFSDKATKTLNSTRVMEYRWDIPSITLNDWGKISMVGRSYKALAPTATPIITRIRNISTKNNIDSWNGNGAVLDASAWNYLVPFTPLPPIPIAPQTINSITLSLNDDIATADNGIVDSTAVFVIVLKITEDDIPQVVWGNTREGSTKQTIPIYNN
mgnify:CR=1 FL=1